MSSADVPKANLPSPATLSSITRLLLEHRLDVTNTRRIAIDVVRAYRLVVPNEAPQPATLPRGCGDLGEVHGRRWSHRR